MTQKLGKSPSLRPCGTGRTFFLSGAVGDPAHLVSFLFHSQFFPCAVGEPLEVFLLSGQSKVSATCIPLFFPALPRVPRASAGGQGPVEIFSLGPPVQRHVPQQAFLLGEPFPGRHLFRAFLSTWNVPAAKVKGECTGHSWERSFLLPYFSGEFPFLLSCPGGFPEGGNFLPEDTACRTSCLGGVFPGAECVCRNNLPDFGVPLPGRDAKPWKISFTPAMQHGQGVFSFRCRERSGASGQLPFP